MKTIFVQLNILAFSFLMWNCQPSPENIRFTENPEQRVVLLEQLEKSPTDTLIDFTNSTANKLPNTWEEALTGDGKPCHWEVKEDAGNKVLAQLSNETNHYRFNLAVNKTLIYKDVDISVKFKGIEGGEDQGGGPMWRYIDENNYYIARANPLENNFRVYKVVNGDRHKLESSKMEINTNQWYQIRVVMKGNKIQCYFENKLVMEVTDNTFIDAGKIGLWTKSDAVTYFDEFKVRKTL